jgi:hypothetical protein
VISVISLDIGHEKWVHPSVNKDKRRGNIKAEAAFYNFQEVRNSFSVLKNLN